MPTTCHRKECSGTAHVLLFASGAQFLAQLTTPGQVIYLCLACGGQVLDVMHAWRDRHRATTPGWLTDDLKADRLPTVLPVEGWSARTKTRFRPRAGVGRP